MPYMSVYGAFNGDTTVGGKAADPAVMADLGAKFATIGQVYKSPLPTLQVLNRLEMRGWRVVSTNSVPNGQTMYTLHMPLPLPGPPGPPMYAHPPQPQPNQPVKL